MKDNVVSSFLKKIYYFFTNKKVVLANQEAIAKMEEFNKNILNNRITEIENSIKELKTLKKNIEEILEIEKINQEFLLYLCTTVEELSNTIGEGNIAVISALDGDFENTNNEDDFISSQWTSSKKNNNILN